MAHHNATLLIVNCSAERADILRREINRIPEVEIVGQVYDGARALEVAGSLRPDILFTCIALPGLSGITLTRQFKKLLPASKVIVGTVQSDARLEALRAGADEFLTYPPAPQEVVEKVARLVGGTPPTKAISAEQVKLAGERPAALPSVKIHPFVGLLLLIAVTAVLCLVLNSWLPAVISLLVLRLAASETKR